MGDKIIEALFKQEIAEKRKANFHFKPKPIRFGIENKSNKELLSMNSDVKTYKFTEIFGKEYKTLPADIQKAQLEFIYKRYNGKITYIAAFYGVTRKTVRDMLLKHGVEKPTVAKKSHKPASLEERKELFKKLRDDIGEERYAAFLKEREQINESARKNYSKASEKTTPATTDIILPDASDAVIEGNDTSDALTPVVSEPVAPAVAEVTVIEETLSDEPISAAANTTDNSDNDDALTDFPTSTAPCLKLTVAGEVSGTALAKKLKSIAKLVEAGYYSFEIKIMSKEDDCDGREAGLLPVL